jgi:hypothetical protein
MRMLRSVGIALLKRLRIKVKPLKLCLQKMRMSQPSVGWSH